MSHIRGNIMGVFIANEKPAGQMETEEEILQGNEQKLSNHQA